MAAGPPENRPRLRAATRTPGHSIAQDLEEKIDIMVELGNRLAQFGDLSARMQDGGMVAAAEVVADLG